MLELVVGSLEEEVDVEELVAGTEVDDTAIADDVVELDSGAGTVIVTGGGLMSITEYFVVVTCAMLADGIMVTTSVSVVSGPPIV